MQAEAAHSDAVFVALLAVAETFRTANPPRIRLCIQSLQALFAQPLPPHLLAIAHLNLGKVLHAYTRNADLARVNLEKAYSYAAALHGFEEMRVQIGSLLAEIYEAQNHLHLSKRILRQEMDVSRRFSFWHCRYLLQLAAVSASDGDQLAATVQLLDEGADFCLSMNVAYTEALFRLSKAMLLMAERHKADVVRPILERVGVLITALSDVGSRRQSLKAFFFIIQICHFLMTGAVKTAKPCLKHLQAAAQALAAAEDNDQTLTLQGSPAEQFIWLPKDRITILVYLVTVVHALQAGQMERVERYAEKALAQVDKLRGRGADRALDTAHVLLLEHSCMARLVVGRPSLALHSIARMCHVAARSTALFGAHQAQLHTLLGLYAMSLRCADAAERQFNAALRTVKDCDRDLWTFLNLNLAVVYLQAGKDSDYYYLLERITPERISSSSQSLLSAAHFVRGLQAFLQLRYQEAKSYLKDSLAISNKEDIARVSALALVLLGNIFLRYQSVKECSDFLSPALDLAKKIPDLNLQIWATALLKDVYKICGNEAKSDESFQVYDAYAQRLLKEQNKAQQMAEHRLIDPFQWCEGPVPLAANNVQRANKL